MPVVDPAFQFPADWASCPSSIGVIRDGDWLRLWFQPQKGKGHGVQISQSEWLGGSSGVRAEFDDRVQKGALVVAGLSPDRGLVRECASPLRNLEKSAEIWPALLDTTLPFPLEECDVAFLPPKVDSERGARCLAAAALHSDIEQACSEWEALQITPDMLIPEVLLLSEHQKSSVWIGRSRSVFTAWHGDHFLGAGGCRGIPPEAKALSRFQTTWKGDVPDMEWTSLGPSAEKEEAVLERNAARAAFLKESCFINLLVRNDEGALSRKLQAKKRNLTILAAGLLLLVAGVPLFIRSALHGVEHRLQNEISMEFFRITGEENSQPGQEFLLASRHVEETMENIFVARDEVSGPQLSRRLQRVLQELSGIDAIATAVEADSSSVVLDVLAKETDLPEVQRRLEEFGDSVELSSAEQGAWRLEVIAP